MARFDGDDVIQLAAFESRKSAAHLDFAYEPDVDWSPDGNRIVFSHGGLVSVIELESKTERQVVVGPGAVVAGGGAAFTFVAGRRAGDL